MKVLFLCSAHSPFWVGGGCKVARILRSALSERGLDVYAAWFPRGGLNAKPANMWSNNARATIFAVDPKIVHSYRSFIRARAQTPKRSWRDGDSV